VSTISRLESCRTFRCRWSVQVQGESRVSTPYVPGSAGKDCCCGNPECTDFEDRMKAWGIPLDEITVVEFVVPLSSTKKDTDERM